MEQQPILRATALTRVFGEGDNAVHAVTNVDLGIAAGEMVLIMGPSGSGKTTLLTMLGGLLRPTSGSIVIDGTDITTLSDAQLTPVRRKSVGFIFQSFNLWETLNVEENIELALNMAGVTGATAKRRAQTLLEDRGLGKRLRFRARDLSGGEKQRVAIARTLLKNPPILILDEATSALDSRTEEAIQSTLNAIGRNRTSIIIAHRLSTIVGADQIVVLDHGKVAERGTHEALLANGGLYAELWRRQADERTLEEVE